MSKPDQLGASIASVEEDAPAARPLTGDDFLGRLYREHHAELCGYLRRKFGPGPPEPEDLAQTAFERFAALEDQQDVPNPKAFLMLTARNLAIDARRRMATRAAAATSLQIATENYHDSSTEDVLSSREELGRLAKVVAELKPKERAAFLMHRIDGLSYVEIARELHVSHSGARLLVERALGICVARMRK